MKPVLTAADAFESTPFTINDNMQLNVFPYISFGKKMRDKEKNIKGRKSKLPSNISSVSQRAQHIDTTA